MDLVGESNLAGDSFHSNVAGIRSEETSKDNDDDDDGNWQHEGHPNGGEEKKSGFGSEDSRELIAMVTSEYGHAAGMSPIGRS